MDIQSVREFEGGSEPLWYFTKGHVDKLEFVGAVKREFEMEIPEEKVYHAYMRYVPTGHKGEQTLNLTRKGIGAFPVTYVDLWCI